MQQVGLKPSFFTFGSILKTCGGGGIQERGKLVHAHIIKTGFESDVYVGFEIVDMYAECEGIEDALVVFYKMPERNVATYDLMITGVFQTTDVELSQKCGKEALNMFIQLQQIGMKPNHLTFLGILGVCSSLEFLEHGKQVHNHVIKGKLELNEFLGSALEQGGKIHAHSIKIGYALLVVVVNALIDMYGKCGSIDDVGTLFGRMLKRDVVSWSVLISGYAQY
ncbi:hypothetical protein KI387_012031 [Taxus chinensis]|uniref:Pentatricopeptide repeat-containing protein n=1 Tax=Taxus chinensis TaxID=29808 RepID=A0AA38CKB9_TAXCH|nr:hypothetical protein KI387_012031 [Taxus chinensis]